MHKDVCMHNQNDYIPSFVEHSKTQSKHTSKHRYRKRTHTLRISSRTKITHKKWGPPDSRIHNVALHILKGFILAVFLLCSPIPTVPSTFQLPRSCGHKHQMGTYHIIHVHVIPGLHRLAYAYTHLYISMHTNPL